MRATLYDWIEPPAETVLSEALTFAFDDES
jgi:hypothetical protein